jgi:chorismate dehydratase
MRDIAVPTDSSTSKTLLPWLLNRQGYEPRIIEMGPDLEKMLESCDGALLIGDRALHHAENSPDLVQMDLGTEWQNETSTPMVFGVFAARRDSPIDKIQSAKRSLLETLNRFENDLNHRLAVITRSSQRVGFTNERMFKYFQNEVRNRLSIEDELGLAYFADKVCSVGSLEWID